MEKGSRNGQDEEFKNFKELTNKLLAVTKKELDRQITAYQKKKGKSAKQTE